MGLLINIKKTYWNRVEHLHKAKNYLHKGLGMVRGNAVDTFYHYYLNNFGDLLTPYLLKHYGYTPVWKPANKAKVVSVGSILYDIPDTYDGLILGSGLINNTRRNFVNAKILAVRGKLTRDRISAPNNVVLGDPGILANKLVKEAGKKYTLGLIPHYVDKNNTLIKNIKNRYNKEVKIIDVLQRPRQVISQISECEYILSSSLHGLIVADSFRIPNGWLILSNKLVGGSFKFQDYKSAFSKIQSPIYLQGNEKLSDLLSLTVTVTNKIDENIEMLDSIYSSLDKFIED